MIRFAACWTNGMLKCVRTESGQAVTVSLPEWLLSFVLSDHPSWSRSGRRSKRSGPRRCEHFGARMPIVSPPPSVVSAPSHKLVNPMDRECSPCAPDCLACARAALRELMAWKESAMQQLAKTDELRKVLQPHKEYLGWDVNEAAADLIQKLKGARQ